MNYQADYFSLFQPYSLLPLLLLFLTSTYFLLKRHLAPKTLPENLPPGSFGWPLIGETFEFFSDKPEEFIQRRLEKYSTAGAPAEVFKTNIIGEPTVFFSGPAANKFIATNEEKLLKLWLPYSQSGLFNINTNIPQENLRQMPITRMYGLLNPEAKIVEKFDWLMRREVREHWEAGEVVVKAYGLVKSFVLTVSCNYLLGMEPERAAKLTGKLDDVVNGLQSIHVDFPGTRFHRGRRAVEVISREVELMIKEKMAVPEEAPAAEAEAEEDLLSIFMAGDQSGKVVLRSTVAKIITGIMAGSYGSLVTAITYMVKFVGQRPDVYEKIYSEHMEILTLRGSDALNRDHINRMKYTWAVACETMRVIWPLVGAFRVALTDFNYAGYTIPKGWKIFWAMSMTNKDPKCFPEPEKFDPSRFMEKEHLPYTFLPFGAGLRMCAGVEYARMAILIFFHNTVTKFKWDLLYPDEKILGGLVLPAPVKGLPIRLHPLSSSISPQK